MTPYPKPWRFEWDASVPRVIAANGNVVAVVSTGTLSGAHTAADIVRVGELIAALDRDEKTDREPPQAAPPSNDWKAQASAAEAQRDALRTQVEAEKHRADLLATQLNICADQLSALLASVPGLTKEEKAEGLRDVQPESHSEGSAPVVRTYATTNR